jgi:1-acyl-sn-glycerol-3-phosphate acyltransferase
MAKEELFRGWYARLAADWTGGAFPVRREGGDVRAVRDALDLVSRDAAVALFPEGTRRVGGLGSAHPGVGYLAIRAACPILPVALVGTERVRRVRDLARRPRIEVHFGEPFSAAADSRPEQIADSIMRAIALLLPEARRGAYGGAQPHGALDGQGEAG